MYTDFENGAVATVLKNNDLHLLGIALNEKFRFVSFLFIQILIK